MPTIAAPGTWPDPGRRCREGKGPLRADLVETEAGKQPAIDPEEAILCRACRAPVTENRQAVSVSGTHIHTFFNPAGIVFEIYCFNRAGGCQVYGEPTAEFAWFAGSRWQYAVCATCQVHLGWFFTLPASSFFGLIRDRLLMPEG